MADNAEHMKKVELLYDYVDEREGKTHKAKSVVDLAENDANQLISWGRAVEPSKSTANDDAKTASAAKK